MPLIPQVASITFKCKVEWTLEALIVALLALRVECQQPKPKGC
jgi:hypothetical protein